MNSEDLGKIIVNAQDEIQSLKKKLDFIATAKNTQQGNGNVAEAQDIQNIYQRLTYTIKKFENSIQTNVDRLLTHNMARPDSVPQKFPSINKTIDSQQHFQSTAKNQSVLANTNNFQSLNENSEYQPFYLPQQKRYQKQPLGQGSNSVIKQNQNKSFEYSRNQKDFSFQKVADKSFEIGRSYLNKNVMDLPRQKSMSMHNTNAITTAKDKSSYQKQKLKLGRFSKPASVLPPEIRNNPFADAVAITESEIYNGLYNLINKGVVPKDVDIMPAFSRGVPPLINKPMIMHEFKEKLIKQEINIEPKIDLINIKLDVQAIQPKPKQDQKVQEQAQASQNSFQRKSFKFKQFVPSNKLLDQSANHDLNQSKRQDDFELTLKETQAKTYPEVLDAYSLHHLIVRKAKVLEETPEYASYKRIYQLQWGQINQLLKEIEQIAKQFDFPMFYLDGKKLAQLSEKITKPTLEELLNCIVNQDMVDEFVKLPKRKYKGEKGKLLAVVKIQSIIRMFLQYREYKRIKQTIQIVKIIQKYARLYLHKKQTKKLIKLKNEQLFDKFKQTLHQFKLDWPEIKLKKRFEIHINSFSVDELKRLTMDKQLQRENIQITRIFQIKDPMVSIIYVCPFGVSDDITNYYYKILELGDVQNFKDRLYFIKPENCDTFPFHFSLSKKLLYSPQALKRIKKLIKGKQGYIVPGYPSNDDIKLATELNIPIMGGDPQISFVNSTKSAARRIFHSCKIDVPPGAFEIYDETEFINTLTVLIANNPEISTWVLKIDDEFQGRGLAYYNVDSINQLSDLLKQYSEVTEEIIQKIKQIVSKTLASKVKIAMPTLYKDYKEYLSCFLRRGGIIEAYPVLLNRTVISSPSLSFFIEPSGEVSLITAYDKIQGSLFINIGCSFPQKSITSNINLTNLCSEIGSKLYEKGVFGYVTADFIVYGDTIQGIGLDCYMNNYQASFFYFDYLMRGKLNKENGKYFASLTENLDNYQSLSVLETSKLEERTYFYCPFVNHPGLQNVKIKNFFQMCRFEAIQFDLEKKYGATFLLVDILQAGGLGVLTIGDDYKTALKLMNLSLNFLMKQAGSVSKSYSDAYGQSRTDCISIVDVISRIRIMTKKIEKENLYNLSTKINYQSQK
ncbi:IQ calmodulin-binding motif protein (macronuclear) [Tetrahymena thermophila SB210]|uniref:IQ calmodulin-binding motif protein n=1 Tax=Tetrahymena thermophila (strain SB210) TaxID=312017 RepID=I7LXU6_TETTS|nr:IQ calmodulin-binding motif protein [Tetrahymena thermophila SB210]EAS06221.3 IQ calmodulin-binding motif protein [Tetrahymena thermophila SB210]|eukprot:XP_001026466.3 IQ calmodulin-binding motif protein [Tetrahymena thermophila SB210]